MKISQVLYINLDHRKDRLVSIQQVLSHCPHPTKRIQGIKPSYEDIKAYNIESVEWVSKYGLIGCVLSHKQCVEYLVSQDLPQDEYSLILEDDAQIHKSFWKLLETISIGEDADVIFFDSFNKTSYTGLHDLYHNTYPLSYKINSGSNCRCPDHIELHGDKAEWSCFYGTHCLAYNNSKLKKMLHWFNKIEIYRNIDTLLILDKELNRYIVQTGLIFQDRKNLNSDIDKKLNRNLDQESIAKEVMESDS